MTIPDDEIALVRQATDIVGLISEHLALRKAGRQWTGLCPFHQEKSPSFSVNAEEGVYYCFGCQASGDAITFVRDIEHLDFLEAVRRLAARANITLHDTNDRDAPEKRLRREGLYETMAKAVAFYHAQLLESPEAEKARSYLGTRGYDERIVEQFQLGYSPLDFDLLAGTLGIATDLLVDSGLGFVNRRGRFQDSFRGRLLFPIFDSGGRVVAMGGRVVPDHTPDQGAAPPKYRNSPETAIYSKRRTLYGLNWAKSDVVATGEIVVCEGYTDVIGCFLAGIERAVATCGTALGEEHFAILRKFARRIVMAFDADSAGEAGADRIYGWERAHDVSVAVATLPAGSDPGELAARDPGLLAQAVRDAQPYLGWRISRLLAASDLRTAEGRARAFKESIAAVAEHPNELVRDQYLVEVAERTAVAEPKARQMLAAELRSRRSSRHGTGPAPAGAPGGPAATVEQGTGPAPRGAPVGPADKVETEALRLAIAAPERVAGMLDRCLFANPMLRACYLELAGADWDVHRARESAGTAVSTLLSRLAVEEPSASPDEVYRRLVEMAATRALEETKREIRLDPGLFPAMEPVRVAIRIAMEDLRNSRDPDRSGAAAEALLGWLIERDREESETTDPMSRPTDPVALPR